MTLRITREEKRTKANTIISLYKSIAFILNPVCCSGVSKKDKRKLERVQRKVAWMIKGVEGV